MTSNESVTPPRGKDTMGEQSAALSSEIFGSRTQTTLRVEDADDDDDDFDLSCVLAAERELASRDMQMHMQGGDVDTSRASSGLALGGESIDGGRRAGGLSSAAKDKEREVEAQAVTLSDEDEEGEFEAFLE